MKFLIVFRIALRVIGRNLMRSLLTAPGIILGVLSRKGMSLMGSVRDGIIIMPYTTAFQRISGRSHVFWFRPPPNSI